MSIKHLSPKERKRLTPFKTVIVIAWPLIILLGLILYFPPKLLSDLLIGTEAKDTVELQNRLDNTEKALAELKAELERKKKQLQYFKKKASKPISVSKSELRKLNFPVIITHYMSWAEFKKRNETATFAQFRKSQIKFYEDQLATANNFINSLKAR